MFGIQEFFFGNANHILKSITEHAPEIARTSEKAFKNIKHTKIQMFINLKNKILKKSPHYQLIFQ